MRAATLLALMGVSRPIYHLIILNEAILIVLSNHINIMLLPASHVTYTVYNFTDLINNSVCLLNHQCAYWRILVPQESATAAGLHCSSLFWWSFSC